MTPRKSTALVTESLWNLNGDRLNIRRRQAKDVVIIRPVPPDDGPPPSKGKLPASSSAMSKESAFAGTKLSRDASESSTSPTKASEGRSDHQPTATSASRAHGFVTSISSHLEHDVARISTSTTYRFPMPQASARPVCRRNLIPRALHRDVNR